VKYNKKTICLY